MISLVNNSGWTGRPSPAAPRGPRGTCSTSWRETRLMLSSPGWVSLSLYQYCHNHIEGASLTLDLDLRLKGYRIKSALFKCILSNVSSLDSWPIAHVWCLRGPGARRADIYLIPPVCILSKLGQTWREGQQTIILFGHNVDCDASASGELRELKKQATGLFGLRCQTV